MAEPKKQSCPSCGVPLDVGVLTCPECGINIRTGEAYQTRVERAKAKRFHPERYHQGIYMGAAVLFVLVMLAGGILQRRTERGIRQNREFFEGSFKTLENQQVHFFRALWEIDSLASAERVDDASALADELVSIAEGKIREMDREVEQRQYRDDDVTWGEEQELKARKRNLRNVISKAERKRERLSD